MIRNSQTTSSFAATAAREDIDAREVSPRCSSGTKTMVVISDGNATAAGMARLLDGKDVKDTVKR